MPDETRLEHVDIVDVDKGSVVEDCSVYVRDGIIHRIDRNGAGAVNGTRLFLSPGLIDSHVHFFLNGSKRPREAFLEGDEQSRMDQARRNAGVAIRAGITIMRDCAAPASLIFRLKSDIERGLVPGPRILACGHALMRPGGHCHWIGGGEVATVGEVRAKLDKLLGQGADFVKLMASGGGLTPGTVPSEADLPLDLMVAAVEVARANQVHITAHCHATESIERAIQAGLDMVEHAGFLSPQGHPVFDEKVAKRILEREMVICPTIYSALQTAEHFRRNGTPHNPLDVSAVERLEARVANAAEFARLGIPLTGGTDAGATNTPFDSLLDELLLYRQAGLSPAGCLQSVTSHAARSLGLTDVGEIKVGYRADFVLLADNPLENLETLRTPIKVFKGGLLAAGGPAKPWASDVAQEPPPVHTVRSL